MKKSKNDGSISLSATNASLPSGIKRKKKEEKEEREKERKKERKKVTVRRSVYMLTSFSQTDFTVPLKMLLIICYIISHFRFYRRERKI